MKEKEMSFLGHIDELRKHLIRIVIAVCIGAIFVYFNINFVMDKILLAPTRNNFIAIELFNKMFKFLGSDATMNYEKDFIIRTRELSGLFNLSMSISFFGGLVIAFPYIIFQVWKFIEPALKPNERKNSLGFIISIAFFFFLGCLFGYYVLTPMALQFLVNYNISDIIVRDYDISSVISTIIQSVIGMGIFFLLPVFTYVLTKLGIISPKFLTEYRKHAIVVILIIAAIITPADLISMTIAAIPLLLLYEISILVSKIIFRRNLRQSKKQMLQKV